MTGGGGGAFRHSNATGGGGAVVTTQISVPAGETLSIYVGQGGAAAIDSEDRSGGAGGGSSAVVAGSTLLVEAGGGGGAAYESQYANGGGGGDANGVGFDSYQLNTDDPPDPCYPTADGGTGGKGANKTGAGEGGVPGTGYPSCSDEAYASGQAGFSVSSTTTPGQGGAGGWTTKNTDPIEKGFGGGPQGGLGYRKGGDGGRSPNNKSGQGGGGGGGYGGGGGGVGTGNDRGFAGGGGGSYVDPLYATTPSYGTAGPGSPGAGGCTSNVAGCPAGSSTANRPGVAGKVELALATGPSARTETAAADVPSTGTSATLHSMANGTGDGADTMTVGVSKSATFASGVLTATSSPSTPPDSDTAITSTISGLNHSTKYYYQIIASNNAGTVYGLVEDFTTPSPPVVVTKQSAPTEITGTSAKVHSSVTTTVSNAVPIIKYSRNSSMTPVLGTATVAPGSVTAGAGATSVQGTITGLSPKTKYYYRAQATNDVGTTLGAVENFTTLPPPTVVTAKSAPTSVTTSGAIVHSSVKTSGSAATPVIKYSKSPTLSTILGTATVNPTSVTPGGAKNVSGTITGLTGGTTYYYRTQAANAVGTAYGAIESFTTTGAPGLLRCPIAPNWARPANMPLPLGKPVVLVHSITTNPKCKLFISARPVRPRGDVRPPIQFFVNPKTGSVVALATTGNAWALVRAVATPVTNPYAFPSRWVARSWWS